MAKIKVSGFNELIDVTNSNGKEIQKIWNSSDYQDNFKINVGNFSIKKGDIKAIMLDSEFKRDTQFTKLQRESEQEEARILLMNSRERAEFNGWGHFSLFYKAVFKKKPDIELKESVINKADEFYSSNPRWIVPSLKIWINLLNLSKDFKMEEGILRILERVEFYQLSRIEKENKNYNNENKLEEIEESLSSKI